MIDVVVLNHGSIILLRTLTDAAREWIDIHCDTEGWQWLGPSLAVDPRYVEPILEGMLNDGLVVKQAG